MRVCVWGGSVYGHGCVAEVVGVCVGVGVEGGWDYMYVYVKCMWF